jgi:hypothetical protein
MAPSKSDNEKGERLQRRHFQKDDNENSKKRQMKKASSLKGGD